MFDFRVILTVFKGPYFLYGHLSDWLKKRALTNQNKVVLSLSNLGKKLNQTRVFPPALNTVNVFFPALNTVNVVFPMLNTVNMFLSALNTVNVFFPALNAVNVFFFRA